MKVLRAVLIASIGLTFTSDAGRAEAPLGVCLNENAPPYSVRHNNVGAGFDLAVAEALAGRLGRTLEIRWFESKLDEARAKLGRARAAMGDKTHEASAAAQEYVMQNPWQSAGVLAAVGVVFGFCLGRQCGGLDAELPPE